MKNLAILGAFLALLIGCSAKDGGKMSRMPLVGNSDCNHGVSVSRSNCRDKNGNLLELNTVDP